MREILTSNNYLWVICSGLFVICWPFFGPGEEHCATRGPVGRYIDPRGPGGGFGGPGTIFVVCRRVAKGTVSRPTRGGGAKCRESKQPLSILAVPGRRNGRPQTPAQTLGSAELSHSLKVSDRRRNTPKSAQNRSESLCVGLWVPCRIFWAWFDPALGPNPARN